MLHEIITRRNLPHWYVAGAAHFVTYRIAGTIPNEVLFELDVERNRLLDKNAAEPPSRNQLGNVNKRLFKKYDDYLDHSQAFCWLRQEAVAAVIRENLYHHHGTKYGLLAYCIMPNHVHVLLQPFDIDTNKRSSPKVGEQRDAGSPLSSIMHSLKSYTAHRLNAILGRKGTFWQGESYDHWVRDDDELERIVYYIRGNPTKAGLVKRPAEWRYSSCHDRLLLDGDDSGWLGIADDLSP